MADGTTETITTSAPNAFAQPYLQYGMEEAARQYQAGAPAYFPGQTYAEFAPQTEQALKAMEQRALAGSPLVSGAQQFAQTAMAGGFGSPAMQYAQGLAGGVDLSQPISAMQGLAGGVDLSEPMSMIRQTAQGGFLGGSPGLQAAIERATRPAQAAAMSGLAQRGRLGSGLGSQAVAETVGDIAANISYQDYNRERQNQIAAQQTLADMMRAQYGTQVAGQQSLADMMRAQYGSALQGAGFLGDVYQQDYARRAGAATAAPGLAELDYGDISRLAGVGQARETQAQRAIDDALRRYQYEQTAPMEALSRYQNLVAGFPMGQTQTQITPYYEPSFGQKFLGGAATLAGLLPDTASTSERLGYGLLGGIIGQR